MATSKGNSKHTIIWKELSKILSKAGVLLPDEDIENITLTKPRSILLHTFRIQKKSDEQEA